MSQQVLTVFLSSTAKDLTAFRDAVHARLTAGGKFKCIRQEDFTGLHAETVAFCSEQAARADFFVGLIGMRRGWEPNKSGDLRSITEIEYDCAKSEGRYIYVTPDDFPVPGNLRETKAAHHRQLEFRKRIRTRIAPQVDFSTPERLAQIVVEHLLTHVNTAPDDDDHQGLSNAIVTKLLAALDARGETQRAATGGLERKTIIELARRLKPSDTLDFDQAVTELDNAVTIALDVIARGQRGSNQGDDLLNAVLARIAERTKAGQFDRASQEVDGALAQLDRREVEQRDTLRRSRLALLEAGIEQDTLRRDAPAVARRVQAIVALEHPDDAAARFVALCKRQDEFYTRGGNKGVNFDLAVAIELARLTFDSAQDADERGTARNNLGNALQTLGERESGTARLEDAVTAYRNALKERTRERAPLDWAVTQNNLGSALAALGERESGNGRLTEAVEAYRAALSEHTRDRTPLDWAMIQNNLGTALAIIGTRESSITRLTEAVEAFRAALTERTRERMPLDWAMTQTNLGNALRTLGERESSITRLTEAVEAFRAALTERTRERVPLDWATTQSNLGIVLHALGQRESGTARLTEAIEAYRNALRERTRERVPLNWATSTGSMGVAMMQLAERQADLATAEQAVAQIEAALQVSRDGGHAPNAEYFEAMLPQARAVRDRLKRDGK
jgi:tetratricopeptide (TPR) repeat protein